MLIKRSEELIIYESPDGGRTVYSRKSGQLDRTLVKKEDKDSDRWLLWRDILKAADSDPALASVVEQAEIVYHLGRKDQN